MRRFPLLPVLAALSIVGCLAGDAPEPQPNITAQISAAALGDGCGSSADADVGRSAGACAEGTVCNFGPVCQPTNLQLTFVFDDASEQGPLPVQIIEARLRDAAGNAVGVLRASSAQVWLSDRYVTWDGMLVSGETRASYTLSDPDWASLGGGRSMTFTLEVVVEIDGIRRTLTSGELTRSPLVAT